MAVKYSQDAIYGGTGVTFLGWLFSLDWVLILGALTSVVGLAVSWYFKAKEDQRKQRLFELEVRKITRELERESRVQSPGCATDARGADANKK